MNDLKKNEVEIFNRFKKSGFQDKNAFQELYKSMAPMIHKAAEKASFGSNIPKSAHKGYAAQAFLDALRTFNPTAGAALQSHVFGSVHQKVKRLNYKYQNLGSMPEPRAQRVGLYLNEIENLKVSLGREPNEYELAKALDMSVNDVRNLQKEVVKDLRIDETLEENAFHEGSIESEKLQYLKYDLLPEEKKVYDHIFGGDGIVGAIKKNGKVDYDSIARKLGMPSTRVRTIASSIKKKFEKYAK